MAGIADLAKRAGVKEDDVKSVIDAIKSLTATERVNIHGFGTFKTTHRAARKGNNPKTGKPIQIAAKSVITFKATQAKPEK
ncbi:HU family DNA-binding protein [Oryzomonas rubra]|uniref:DNA-binding protein HU-beta n=1 Tax=Oryzomonas rubra TaxID=2509454 RepID=A0A5A9X7S4_9BACT|nr:HU family DNA-binding protein [Oryzomonas rubra]KAA0888703.1 hypothetical protein ET418_15090 [Oryzomonas rubra]